MAAKKEPRSSTTRTATAAARTPASGPLTLAQARALVAAATAPASPASRAPRRSASSGGDAAQQDEAGGIVRVAAERRRLGIDQREELRQRMRDYAATMALLQQRGVKGLPPAAAKAAAARGGRRRVPGAIDSGGQAGGPLRVLAEGDSWFDYPVPFFGGGLVPRLEKRLGVPILNLAQAGDETRLMLGVRQRRQLAQRLEEGCPDGQRWELLLFSGGGNDIVGDPLALWLHPYDASRPPARLLRAQRFAAALTQIRSAYEDLIELRDRLSPTTHLVLHAYDFALPDGRGICHLGPWLKPAFDLHGFPTDRAASSEVVRHMLLKFAAMLRSLAAAPRVTFVDVQGTLAPVPASWHNEMHPGKAGFNAIADVFHARIGRLFPGRVLA